MWQIRPQAEATFERTNAKISEHRLSLLSPAVAWFCAASLAGNLAAIDTPLTATLPPMKQYYQISWKSSNIEDVMWGESAYICVTER